MIDLESMCKWVEGQRERERFSSQLPTQSGAKCGAWSFEPEIVTWAEIKSWMLEKKKKELDAEPTELLRHPIQYLSYHMYLYLCINSLNNILLA